MNTEYNEKDYLDIAKVLDYPFTLKKNLFFMEDTSKIEVPKDPIEKVIFQDRAKWAIRKIAQNKGHILMVGKPGTGKSLLAEMFNKVLDKSLGDFIKPKKAIVAYPGKDENNLRIAYENPSIVDKQISHLQDKIEEVKNSTEKFSLSSLIKKVRRVKYTFIVATVLSMIAGIFFPIAFVITGFTGIGAIFMFIQENNNKVQEKIQRNASDGKTYVVKKFQDMIPEILYDPRKEESLMAYISEPEHRNMKGGFRHDPYQSGNLQTPIHRRAFLGAHAKSPIICIDELKTLVKVGYMSNLLEIMQSKKYILEGGQNSGSGAADRSEDSIIADNIFIACCNHDTLEYLRKEGDGAFLSRIEDKGEVIVMESSVPENQKTIKELVQYIKQEIISFGKELTNTWQEVIDEEGYEGVRKRSEQIFGKPLPEDYVLKEREFAKSAVLEIVKELRCRSSEGKLSSVLRPVNGLIKSAEYEAILENSPLVTDKHVKKALIDHIPLEGALSKDMVKHKGDLKKHIYSLTDAIGYVTGLSVITSGSGRMYGQPLPIHCQISVGSDTVSAPGKTGEIAKAAAQNVRAAIKKLIKETGSPNIGYEMHVEYIQAHGGVEGDSASVAMDAGLISDFINHPINLKYGITGSLTGDIVLAVGGVTEKVRSIMDLDLKMEGACIPWQNRQDIEPLLVNCDADLIIEDGIPGIRIFRSEEKKDPFDIYFCKTRYNVYRVIMGLSKLEIEKRMKERVEEDLKSLKKNKV